MTELHCHGEDVKIDISQKKKKKIVGLLSKIRIEHIFHIKIMLNIYIVYVLEFAFEIVCSHCYCNQDFGFCKAKNVNFKSTLCHRLGLACTESGIFL